MTLDMKTQNKCLLVLSEVLGIMESYSARHEITCKPEQMVRFLAACRKKEIELDLAELHIEYVDFKHDLVKTFVANR